MRIYVRMRICMHASCGEKKPTFYVQYVFFFKNRTEYEIVWRNMIDDNITRCRKDAICMPDNKGKNTDTQSQYLIRVVNSSTKCFVSRQQCK